MSLFRKENNMYLLDPLPTPASQKELNNMTYEEYLDSHEWKQIRDKMKIDSGEKCNLCGKTNHRLNIHHNTYTKRGWETKKDLICLCRECHDEFHGPRITETLDPSSTKVGYLLGRLFAVYERIQIVYHGKDEINKTITESYYKAVNLSPTQVIPQLQFLANSHLAKIRKENKKKYEDFNILLNKIHKHIGRNFPKKLSFEAQFEFQIGYFHQRNKFFKLKHHSNQMEK